jgi:hypothetical protein
VFAPRSILLDFCLEGSAFEGPTPAAHLVGAACRNCYDMQEDGRDWFCEEGARLATDYRR